MGIIDNLPALTAPAAGDEIPIERGTAACKIDYTALASAIIDKLVTDAVYNGLDKTDAGWALDARQGKALKDAVDAKVATADIANDLTTTAAGKVLDARQGKALADMINRSNVTSDIALSTEEGTFAQYSAYKSGSIVFIAFTFKPSVAKSAGQSYNFSLTYSSANAGLRPATRSYNGGAASNAVHHVAAVPDTATHAYIYVGAKEAIAANAAAFWITVPYICYA